MGNQTTQNDIQLHFLPLTTHICETNIRYIGTYLQARPYVEAEEIGEEIIDKKLGGNYDVKSMKSIARVSKLALRCVHISPTDRPSITDVVGGLKEAQIQCPVRWWVDSSKPKDMEWGGANSNLPPKEYDESKLIT